MADDATFTNEFSQALAVLRGGDTLNELHHALKALVGEVRSTAKPGELVLKLKVGLAKGSTSTLVISDEVKVVDPKQDREITLLFADDNNNLSRQDPRQPKLPGMPGKAAPVLRMAVNENIDKGTGEVRE